MYSRDTGRGNSREGGGGGDRAARHHHRVLPRGGVVPLAAPRRVEAERRVQPQRRGVPCAYLEVVRKWHAAPRAPPASSAKRLAEPSPCPWNCRVDPARARGGVHRSGSGAGAYRLARLRRAGATPHRHVGDACLIEDDRHAAESDELCVLHPPRYRTRRGRRCLHLPTRCRPRSCPCSTGPFLRSMPRRSHTHAASPEVTDHVLACRGLTSGQTLSTEASGWLLHAIGKRRAASRWKFSCRILSSSHATPLSSERRG